MRVLGLRVEGDVEKKLRPYVLDGNTPAEILGRLAADLKNGDITLTGIKLDVEEK